MWIQYKKSMHERWEGRLCGGGGCGEGGKPGVGESVLKGDEYNDGNCQFVLSKDLNGKMLYGIQFTHVQRVSMY